MCNEINDLTRAEKKRLRFIDKELRRWRKLLMLDPIWNIKTISIDDEEMAGRAAFVDLGSAEYYQATVGVTRFLLSEVDDETFVTIACDIGAHEMFHIVTADYHRAAIVAAGENEALRSHIDYMYEQFTSRMTVALCKMDKRIRKFDKE